MDKELNETTSESTKLKGCYLLVILSAPKTKEDKDEIIQRVAKALLSWDTTKTNCDLKELHSYWNEASNRKEVEDNESDMLVQYSNAQMAIEILYNPQIYTVKQCLRNLFQSFTAHKQIIYSGYTYLGTGNWILNDSVFSASDFVEQLNKSQSSLLNLKITQSPAFCHTAHLHCLALGDWQQLEEQLNKPESCCTFKLNPSASDGVPGAADLIDFLQENLHVQTDVLNCSEIVGNIRFARPTLYIMPSGQGDSCVFGINGFTMLIDGGFNSMPSSWQFIRHLEKIDSVLITRFNENNCLGLQTLFDRLCTDECSAPKIGRILGNLPDINRLASLEQNASPNEPNLEINLIQNGQRLVSKIEKAGLLPPKALFRAQDVQQQFVPIELYHRIGFGTLNLYIFNPLQDSKLLHEYLTQFEEQNRELFSNVRMQTSGSNLLKNLRPVSLANLTSISLVLAWLPADLEENVVRLFLPGSTPTYKLMDVFSKLQTKHSNTELSILLSHECLTRAEFDKLVCESKPKQVKISTTETESSGQQPKGKLKPSAVQRNRSISPAVRMKQTVEKSTPQFYDSLETLTTAKQQQQSKSLVTSVNKKLVQAKSSTGNAAKKPSLKQTSAKTSKPSTALNKPVSSNVVKQTTTKLASKTDSQQAIRGKTTQASDRKSSAQPNKIKKPKLPASSNLDFALGNKAKSLGSMSAASSASNLTSTNTIKAYLRDEYEPDSLECLNSAQSTTLSKDSLEASEFKFATVNRKHKDDDEDSLNEPEIKSYSAIGVKEQTLWDLPSKSKQQEQQDSRTDATLSPVEKPRNDAYLSDVDDQFVRQSIVDNVIMNQSTLSTSTVIETDLMNKPTIDYDRGHDVSESADSDFEYKEEDAEVQKIFESEKGLKRKVLVLENNVRDESKDVDINQIDDSLPIDNQPVEEQQTVPKQFEKINIESIAVINRMQIQSELNHQSAIKSENSTAKQVDESLIVGDINNNNSFLSDAKSTDDKQTNSNVNVPDAPNDVQKEDDKFVVNKDNLQEVPTKKDENVIKIASAQQQDDKKLDQTTVDPTVDLKEKDDLSKVELSEQSSIKVDEGTKSTTQQDETDKINTSKATEAKDSSRVLSDDKPVQQVVDKVHVLHELSSKPELKKVDKKEDDKPTQVEVQEEIIVPKKDLTRTGTPTDELKLADQKVEGKSTINETKDESLTKTSAKIDEKPGLKADIVDKEISQQDVAKSVIESTQEPTKLSKDEDRKLSESNEEEIKPDESRKSSVADQLESLEDKSLSRKQSQVEDRKPSVAEQKDDKESNADLKKKDSIVSLESTEDHPLSRRSSEFEERKLSVSSEESKVDERKPSIAESDESRKSSIVSVKSLDKNDESLSRKQSQLDRKPSLSEQKDDKESKIDEVKDLIKKVDELPEATNVKSESKRDSIISQTDLIKRDSISSVESTQDSLPRKSSQFEERKPNLIGLSKEEIDDVKRKSSVTSITSLEDKSLSRKQSQVEDRKPSLIGQKDDPSKLDSLIKSTGEGRESKDLSKMKYDSVTKQSDQVQIDKRTSLPDEQTKPTVESTAAHESRKLSEDVDRKSSASSLSNEDIKSVDKKDSIIEEKLPELTDLKQEQIKSESKREPISTRTDSMKKKDSVSSIESSQESISMKKKDSISSIESSQESISRKSSLIEERKPSLSKKDAKIDERKPSVASTRSIDKKDESLSRKQSQVEDVQVKGDSIVDNSMKKKESTAGIVESDKESLSRKSSTKDDEVFIQSSSSSSESSPVRFKIDEQRKSLKDESVTTDLKKAESNVDTSPSQDRRLSKSDSTKDEQSLSRKASEAFDKSIKALPLESAQTTSEHETKQDANREMSDTVKQASSIDKPNDVKQISEVISKDESKVSEPSLVVKDDELKSDLDNELIRKSSVSSAKNIASTTDRPSIMKDSSESNRKQQQSADKQELDEPTSPQISDSQVPISKEDTQMRPTKLSSIEALLTEQLVKSDKTVDEKLDPSKEHTTVKLDESIHKIATDVVRTVINESIILSEKLSNKQISDDKQISSQQDIKQEISIERDTIQQQPAAKDANQPKSNVESDESSPKQPESTTTQIEISTKESPPKLIESSKEQESRSKVIEDDKVLERKSTSSEIDLLKQQKDESPAKADDVKESTLLLEKADLNKGTTIELKPEIDKNTSQQSTINKDEINTSNQSYTKEDNLLRKSSVSGQQELKAPDLSDSKKSDDLLLKKEEIVHKDEKNLSKPTKNEISTNNSGPEVIGHSSLEEGEIILDNVKNEIISEQFNERKKSKESIDTNIAKPIDDKKQEVVKMEVECSKVERTSDDSNNKAKEMFDGEKNKIIPQQLDDAKPTQSAAEIVEKKDEKLISNNTTSDKTIGADHMSTTITDISDKKEVEQSPSIVLASTKLGEIVDQKAFEFNKTVDSNLLKKDNKELTDIDIDVNLELNHLITDKQRLENLVKQQLSGLDIDVELNVDQLSKDIKQADKQTADEKQQEEEIVATSQDKNEDERKQSNFGIGSQSASSASDVAVCQDADRKESLKSGDLKSSRLSPLDSRSIKQIETYSKELVQKASEFVDNLKDDKFLEPDMIEELESNKSDRSDSGFEFITNQSGVERRHSHSTTNQPQYEDVLARRASESVTSYAVEHPVISSLSTLDAKSEQTSNRSSRSSLIGASLIGIATLNSAIVTRSSLTPEHEKDILQQLNASKTERKDSKPHDKKDQSSSEDSEFEKIDIKELQAVQSTTEKRVDGDKLADSPFKLLSKEASSSSIVELESTILTTAQSSFVTTETNTTTIISAGTADSCIPSLSVTSTTQSDEQKQREAEKEVDSWSRPIGLPPPDLRKQRTAEQIVLKWKPLGRPSPLETSIDKNVAKNLKQNSGTTLKSNATTPATNRQTGAQAINHTANDQQMLTASITNDSAISSLKPFHFDLLYVSHHGEQAYNHLEFFKKCPAKNYVLSGSNPSRETLDAILEARKQLNNESRRKDKQYTPSTINIIPTHESESLFYWISDRQNELQQEAVEVSPSASRCTVTMVNHEDEVCSAYRIQF